MKKNIKNTLKDKFIIILSTCLLISIFLFYFSSQKKHSNNLSANIISFVTSPFQKAIYYISNNSNNWLKNTFNKKQIIIENNELQAEINKLRNQLVDFNKYKTQNQELLKLLDIKDSYNDYKFKSSLVIGKISNDPFKSFIIDKGKNDGIKPYSPIITPEGLIGYVDKVNLSTSIVKTILHKDISIGIYDVNNGESGILTGDINLSYKNKSKMKYLSRQTSIKADDIIITSGTGNNIPNGLLVGKIVDIASEHSSTSIFGLIKPFCNFDNLNHVFIITSFTKKSLDNPSIQNNFIGQSLLTIGISK